MNMKSAGREYYNLTISTTPAVNGWQASFDSGATWAAGTVSGTLTQWLVAGPTNTDTVVSGQINLVGTVVPVLIRSVTNPEDLIRDAPPIYIR